MVERHLKPHRHDTRQDHGTHALGMTAHVDLRRPGPVGSAVQVDPLVAQPPLYLGQVIHRDGRGIERQIGPVGQLGHTGTERPGRKKIAQIALWVLIATRQSAIQWVRCARAPLVHQHDLPIAPQFRQGGGRETRERGGTLTWTAGEDEERVGLRIGLGRRQNGDPQRDLPTDPCFAILVNLVRGAAGLLFEAGQLTGLPLNLPGGRLCPGRKGLGPERCQRENRCGEAKVIDVRLHQFDPVSAWIKTVSRVPTLEWSARFQCSEPAR